MRIKSIIVVLLASLSVVAHAHAQTKTDTLTDAKTGNTAGNTSGSSRATSVDQPQAAVAVGWNYYHAAACQAYYDGTFHWLYVITVEGPVFSTPVQADHIALAPACQSGNLVGVYVTSTNGSSFTWGSFVVFPVK